jgi:hypothetical protein
MVRLLRSTYDVLICFASGLPSCCRPQLAALAAACHGKALLPCSSGVGSRSGFSPSLIDDRFSEWVGILGVAGHFHFPATP